jgi:hypothetical protein
MCPTLLFGAAYGARALEWKVLDAIPSRKAINASTQRLTLLIYDRARVPRNAIDEIIGSSLLCSE